MMCDELKRLRKSRHLKQSEVADALHMSQATVAAWENGARRPDVDMIVEIAKFYGCTTDEIFGLARSDNDRELWELREQVRRDPERHILFSLAKDGDIKQVRQTVAIIGALKRADGGDDNDPA